jgi:methylated-DNA-[protein]-cysteine S-methyltransferase
MAKRTKASPERLYGSTLSWTGLTFRVLSSLKGLRRIDLAPGPIEELERRLKVRIIDDDEPNETVLDQLHAYLRGERRTFSAPLDVRGTPFQQEVWNAISAIPYGGTVSYSELAESIGRPTALRAVGQAVGANPTPIVIPCHRVIGKTGKLVGFAGGLPLKEKLLMLEQGSLRL